MHKEHETVAHKDSNRQRNQGGHGRTLGPNPTHRSRLIALVDGLVELMTA